MGRCRRRTASPRSVCPGTIMGPGGAKLSRTTTMVSDDGGNTRNILSLYEHYSWGDCRHHQDCHQHRRISRLPCCLHRGFVWWVIKWSIKILKTFNFSPHRQKRDDDAVHNFRVSQHRSLDRAWGPHGAGDGCLPDHECGHHHHGGWEGRVKYSWHLMLPGQRGGDHGYLDCAAVLPLALRGVPLPDTGRGHEYGIRQGQSVTGGEN